jgi:hypothetical protein
MMETAKTADMHLLCLIQATGFVYSPPVSSGTLSGGCQNRRHLICPIQAKRGAIQLAMSSNR